MTNKTEISFYWYLADDDNPTSGCIEFIRKMFIVNLVCSEIINTTTSALEIGKHIIEGNFQQKNAYLSTAISTMNTEQ